MTPAPAKPIVIDTDIGADPDDALALMLALASPEVEVRGVTIVSGEATARGRMAARLLGLAGRPDIPVCLGAGEGGDPDPAPASAGHEGPALLDEPYDGPEATIQQESAVDWLIAESWRRPFHLVAIGPLTNVALAMERDSGFARRLLSLTVMGGLLDARTMPEAWQRDIAARGGAGWPDYNTTSDPAASLAVARAGIPITWVTLDATMRASLRERERRRLPADRPLGRALGRMIDSWHAFWFPTALRPPLDRGPVTADAVAILHDPLAVAAVIGGDWPRLEATMLRSAIEDGVFRLHECRAGEGTPGRIASGVDGDGFAAFCMARIVRQIERTSGLPPPATES